MKAVHLLLLPVRSARLGHQELEGSAACMLPVALHMPLCCTRVQKSNSLVPFNLLPLQGLQDKMELVAIDLQDKPAWYKDKVYAQGTVLFLGCSCLASYHPEHLREHCTTVSRQQVPSLEHDSEVRGESLDLIRYIDSNFDGPALLPEVRYLPHRTACS